MNLERKLDEMETQIRHLQHEVSELRAELNRIKGKPGAAKTVYQPPEPVLTEQRPAAAKIKAEPVDWERVIGQVWLPRVFILVLLLGVLWAFKAASDEGFITDTVKCILGFLSSAALIACGEWQIKKGRAALGQVLLGGAIVIFILSTFSANVLYGLMPSALAFALNVIWVSAGMFLSHRHRSQPVAVLAGIAGFLVPFLVESESNNALLFVAYEFLFYAGLLVYAMKKKYIVLYFSSFFLLHAALFVFAAFAPGENSPLILTAILFQHAGLVMTYFIQSFYQLQQKTLVLISFVLTHFWFQALADETVYLGFIGASFAVYAAVAAWLFLKKTETEKLDIFAPIATYAAGIYIVEVTGQDQISLLLLLHGLVALYVGFAVKGNIQKYIGLIVYVIGLLASCTKVIDHVWSYETAVWMSIVASLIALKLMLRKYGHEFKESDVRFLNAVLFAGLVITTFIFATMLVLAAASNMSFEIRMMSVTGIWALYAVLCVVYGVLKNHRKVRILGIGLLFLTLSKLVLLDLVSLSIVLRAILFIALGTVGIGLSRFFYKTK
ncbi:DUF2339 domain-containing protein [Peribacillus frigoritolerans]|uniref:DUF2339 domain-containing protein n=1 Tax=Peribacillus frigoritolerans TaxID=450367 RepID=UPI001059F491|nr:DUF2339 domain-containing protein [Peribacillus frigoritolerans]TDL80320.1 DUF2339 domain-containing protein [Peribacillus frigoritolerans]